MNATTVTTPVAEGRPSGVSPARIVLVTVGALTIVIAAAIYPLVSPLVSYGPITPVRQATIGLIGLAWIAVLLVALVRQPHGRLWKLLFLVIVAERIYMFSFVPNSLVWSIARPLESLAIPVTVHFLLAFPSGHLRDRFDRTVVVYAYVLAAVTTVARQLVWDNAMLCDPECVRNLFVVWPDRDLFRWIENFQSVAAAATLIPLVLVAVWRHWRDASHAARRTLLPLIVAVPVQAAAIALDTVSHALDIKPIAAFFDSPSGEVIRLFTALMLPIGLVILIVRTRLGRSRVASLMVELGRGVPIGGLRDILAGALGDPTLQLAFAAPSGSGFVDAGGRPVNLPAVDSSRMVTRLERDGELLGVLVHDPAIEAEDPGFVEAVGNAARLALENERLAAEVRAQLEEVRASRARIVEAADSERRRVERDLHDGAQQRLVALAMRLQVAKETTAGASELLDAATTELQTAIGEVRGLARGIHPTILTEAGLRAAIDALAERTPFPVAIDVSDRRYQPQVEATAYFVVAEALTNVARHAEANEARVSTAVEEGRLVVTVVDDGRGGADVAAGSGLRGLADRLAAVDGDLTVSSSPGAGTTLRAELPLDHPGSSIGTGQTEPSELPGSGSRVRPEVLPPTTLGLVRAVSAAPRARASRGRDRLSSPVVLIVLLVGVIAVLAVSAAVAGGPARLPIYGRADGFVRPFDYHVPADSNIVLVPKSDHLNVLQGPSQAQGGISIWVVEGVVVDHCASKVDSPLVAREPGIDGLLVYLRSVPHLHMEEVGPWTIDGRPGVRVELSAEGGVTGCPDHSSLFLWRDSPPTGEGHEMQVPEQGRVPVILVEVDGATVALEIWHGDPRYYETWFPAAEEIIDSIRFLYRPPAP
jgi:signal transduction histidine kinase